MDLSTARRYLDAGLAVLPAIRTANGKQPALSRWRDYQLRLPTAEEVDTWFGGEKCDLCVVTGAVSGHLEVIDFDAGGELYEAWRELVRDVAPGLLERLVIERTPSGGFHAFYRCPTGVEGSVKLAERRLDCEGPDEILFHGKPHKPREGRDGRWHALVTLIETRGEKGVCLCAPSAGYAPIQGDLGQIPAISSEGREDLLACARALNEAPEPVIEQQPKPARRLPTGELRPGDDFNQRGDVHELLLAHGWALERSGENEHWRRPGKARGTSATLKDGVLYVFSSNAAPFEPNRAYSPFTAYALLEHYGDYAKAASELRSQGYGSTVRASVANSDAHGESALLPRWVSALELVSRHPTMRPPVIEGLLRKGETMNVVAASKVGKSWLALDLALSVASGTPWLGKHRTTPGSVLYIDNELHPETIASRVRQVAHARNLDFRTVGPKVCFETLRGNLRDIHEMASYFRAIEPGRFTLVILDAAYRFMPADGDENSNSQMARIYNAIDRYAAQLGSAFALVHHTTKGNQSGKHITDVGAGGGSQSRAADTHLVLRPHEEERCAVLDAVARSWEAISPCVLEWTFPVWNHEPDLDARQLRRDRKPERTGEPGKRDWSAKEFVHEFLDESPRTRDEIAKAAASKGVSARAVLRLIADAEAQKLVHRWHFGSNQPQKFATVPSPTPFRMREVS